MQDPELERLLRVEVQAAAVRIAELDCAIGKLTNERAHARSVGDCANALLSALGCEPEPMPARDDVPAALRRNRSGFATIGNRNPATPERRPEFAAIALYEAIARVLSDGRTYTTDDLVSAIYEAQTPREVSAARNSLRTNLATGVDRGDWVRLRPGVFVLKPPN